ncbi:unnamed protein product [Rotaria magnacalcarata]
MKTLHEESNANIQAFILSYCCPSVLVYSCFSVYVENSSHPYIPSVKKEPAMRAGYHILSNAERKSTNMQSDGLLQAVIVCLKSSISEIILAWSRLSGSCFRRKADVPALSLDFFDLNLFYSSSTSFNHCIQMVVVAFVEIRFTKMLLEKVHL